VPKNLKRYYGSSDLRFITCSCYHRQPLLGTPHLRDLFLKALEQMRTRYRFVVLGYVVMPEHFHLLISEPHQGIHSTVMQAIKLGFARRVLGSGGAHVWPGLPDMGTQTASGSVASTTSMFGPSASGLKSCATCIEIR
jgi:REP element-mobilizing transposase RayT